MLSGEATTILTPTDFGSTHREFGPSILHGTDLFGSNASKDPAVAQDKGRRRRKEP